MRPKKARQIAAIVERPGEAERGYLAREFVVCGLPMRDPKEPKYTRRNGRDTLTLTSGTDARGEFVGLPYGSIPRLLLYWFVSEAIRTKSRRLQMGGTTNGFLRAVGLDPGTGGGKRGDVTRLREQWRRLIGCRISFIRREGDAVRGGERTLDMLVSEKSETWWDFTGADRDGLFDGYVVLSEAFYDAITRSPVPFDFRALCALKSSPFAIDLYVWLARRVHAFRGRSARVPLHGEGGIADQIGSDYVRDSDFKAALSEGLEAVKQVWPALDYTLTATHLSVQKSRPPSPRHRETTPARAIAGYVYLLSDPYGNYKIGKALSPQGRCAQISPKMPFAPTLEHWIMCEDYDGAERMLHGRFAARRGHGEWFRLTATEVADIKAIAAIRADGSLVRA